MSRMLGIVVRVLSTLVSVRIRTLLKRWLAVICLLICVLRAVSVVVLMVVVCSDSRWKGRVRLVWVLGVRMWVLSGRRLA